jgi:hypothetical protein
MNENLDPLEAVANDDPAERPLEAKRSPGLRITGQPDTSAPVTTTALISAIEPKLPPFRGD